MLSFLTQFSAPMTIGGNAQALQNSDNLG